MPSMEIERRAFLKAAAAGAVVLLGPTLASATPSVRELYLNACRFRDGRFGIAAFDAAGSVLRAWTLPDRGHSFAVSRDGSRAVAFARRPRGFALAFEPRNDREPALFGAPPGRHFYGHGVFADRDRLLLATENDFDGARGVVGVYDVAAGYRRIGEFASGGVGPHELVMLPDERRIAVANGGIETHPEAGDAKLNLATMAPSLTFLDFATGDVVAEHRLDPALHQLSIRHLAVDADGSVWFGCQHQGPAGDRPPLLGHAGPDSSPVMVLGQPNISASMSNYIGSVARSADGSLIAASSPRGGRIIVVDLKGRLVATADLADGCGVAPAGATGILASSGRGEIAEIEDGEATPVAQTSLAFDNHMALVV